MADYVTTKANKTRNNANKSNYLEKLILKNDESERWKKLSQQLKEEIDNENSEESNLGNPIKKQGVLIVDDIRRKGKQLKSFSISMLRWLNHSGLSNDENEEESNGNETNGNSTDNLDMSDIEKENAELEKENLSENNNEEPTEQNTQTLKVNGVLENENNQLENKQINLPPEPKKENIVENQSSSKGFTIPKQFETTEGGISYENNITPSMLKAVERFRILLKDKLNIKDNDLTDRLLRIALENLRSKSVQTDFYKNIANLYEQCIDDAIAQLTNEVESKNTINQPTKTTAENIENSEIQNSALENIEENSEEENSENEANENEQNENEHESKNDAYEYRKEILKGGDNTIPDISKKYAKFKLFKNKELKNLISGLDEVNAAKGRLITNGDFDKAKEVLKTSMEDYKKAKDDDDDLSLSLSDSSEEDVAEEGEKGKNAKVNYKDKLKNNYPYFENLLRNYDFIDSEEDKIRQALDNIYELYKVSSANTSTGKFEDYGNEEGLDIGKHKQLLATDANIIADLSAHLRDDRDYEEEYNQLQDLIKIREFTQEDDDHYRSKGKNKDKYATIKNIRLFGAYIQLLKQLPTPTEDLKKELEYCQKYVDSNANTFSGENKIEKNQLSFKLKDISKAIISYNKNYSAFRFDDIDALKTDKLSKIYDRLQKDNLDNNIDKQFFNNFILWIEQNPNFTFDSNTAEGQRGFFFLKK